MVRINLITILTKYIADNNLRSMTKWSLRNVGNSNPRYSGYKLLVSQIRDLLNLLSGDDILGMLKSILEKDELNKLAPDKYINSFKNLVSKKKYLSKNKTIELIFSLIYRLLSIEKLIQNNAIIL